MYLYWKMFKIQRTQRDTNQEVLYRIKEKRVNFIK